MKKTLPLFLALISFNALSATQSFDVLSTDLGVHDKTLCLTVLRAQDSSLIGVVEDIYDCFIARDASHKQRLKLDLKKLKHIENQNLQSYDAQLKFYLSEGD
jgi:hypothetical protein